MEHVRTFFVGKKDCKNSRKIGCGECQASCQSACKVSCTVANQKCEHDKSSIVEK